MRRRSLRAALAAGLLSIAAVPFARAQDAPPPAEMPPEATAPATAAPEPLEASSNPDSKPEPSILERMRIFGGRIGGEVREQTEKLPQKMRELPGKVQERVGEGVEGLAKEVPFPGAPPPEDRSGEFARQFFLELPAEEEEIEAAEGFGLIPQLGYTEETGFIYGLAFAWGGLVEKRDNWQLTIENSTRNHLKGEIQVVSPESLGGNVRFEFTLSGRRANANYFGEGNKSLEQAKDLYDFRAYDLGVGIWPKLSKYFRVGALLRVSAFEPKVVTYDPAGPFFLPGSPVGFDGGRIVQVGAGAALDSRDNEFFPSKGFLAEVRGYRTNGGFAADFSYTSVSYDARAFFRLGSPAYVLGLRALFLTTSNGDVPFFWEPALGGSSIDRGISVGRFRDRNALIVQSELRAQIYGRVGCALYFDAGQVAHDWEDLGVTRFKPSGGGALTYIVPPGRVMVVRLEVAGSEEGATFFLNLGHPF